MKTLVAIAILLLMCVPVTAAELFVATSGADSNPGTAAKPFATLERARDAIRAMKKSGPLPAGGVTVWVKPGVYPILSTLKLTEEDSGTETAPIIYRAMDSSYAPPVPKGKSGLSISLGAYSIGGRLGRGGHGGIVVGTDGSDTYVGVGGGGSSLGGFVGFGGRQDPPLVDGDARLVGGREIDGFKPVVDSAILQRLDPAARDKVLQVDLKAHGISSFGEMTPRGFGRPNQPAGLELFCNDKPMTLAEWPNNGWTETTSVPDGPNGGKFGYDSDRCSRWKQSGDIWVHGYWTWPWADSYEHVKSIDTKAKIVETYPPHGIYGYAEHKRFRFLNVLEELDSPGEWYLDRESGILYFWPPEPIGRGTAVVSVIRDPMVSISGASYVTLRGFTIEACRGNAVEISGGTHNLVAGCTIRNVGNVGVTISDGTQNGVSGCDIYETGDGGVNLAGGDRKTLTSAGNFVENCLIRDYSRWVRTYRPAVVVGGVGNRVAHCHIYNAPHMGIGLSGNDHIVEFNEINNILRETGDAGAFYMGRDWTMRGNVVRFNYFHDLGGYDDKFSAAHFSDTMAVYLDDWASGTRVYGNLFYKANRAVMIGGGRDNTVQNNIFVDCTLSVHVDARGIAGWTASYWDGRDNTMFDRLKTVNGTQPPYSTRYPQLANILKDEPRLPKGNSITRNISVGGKWIGWVDKFDTKMVEVKDNLVQSEPGFSDPQFVDREHLDFRLKPDSPALKLGFKQLPLDKMGLYVDEYRRSASK